MNITREMVIIRIANNSATMKTLMESIKKASDYPMTQKSLIRDLEIIMAINDELISIMFDAGKITK